MSATSQTLTVPSTEALARRSPAGLNARQLTVLSCPVKAKRRLPVAVSQKTISTGAGLSPGAGPELAVTSSRPSGLSATAVTGLAWTAMVRFSPTHCRWRKYHSNERGSGSPGWAGTCSCSTVRARLTFSSCTKIWASVIIDM